MSEQLDQARAELMAFFQKTAVDLIPLLVNSIIKEPPPPPPIVKLENVIIAYAMPDVGQSMMFPPPEGGGWTLTSLDTNAGDRILGHWMRHVAVIMEAEFADTYPPPDWGHDFSNPQSDGCANCGMSAEAVYDSRKLCEGHKAEKTEPRASDAPLEEPVTS